MNTGIWARKTADDLFRRARAMAWPYAVYCATRYLRDVDAAYDLMDAVVGNTEEYYIRFNGARNSATTEKAKWKSRLITAHLRTINRKTICVRY